MPLLVTLILSDSGDLVLLTVDVSKSLSKDKHLFGGFQNHFNREKEMGVPSDVLCLPTRIFNESKPEDIPMLHLKKPKPNFHSVF